MKSKKKFLLLGVGVMGALALGVGATSTFAWFQSQQTVNIAASSTQEGAMTAAMTNVSVGSFTFTLSGLTATASDKAVDLTNADGESWVFIDATNKQQVTPGNPTCEWSGLTFGVSYSGPSDTGAKIQVEWENVKLRYSAVSVTVSSDTGNTHAVRFGDTGATAAQCSGNSKVLLNSYALSSISWSSATVTGTGANRAASIDLTSQITSAFATALTALTTNEGAQAAGTHGITVAISLTEVSQG